MVKPDLFLIYTSHVWYSVDKIIAHHMSKSFTNFWDVMESDKIFK